MTDKLRDARNLEKQEENIKCLQKCITIFLNQVPLQRTRREEGDAVFLAIFTPPNGMIDRQMTYFDKTICRTARTSSNSFVCN